MRRLFPLIAGVVALTTAGCFGQPAPVAEPKGTSKAEATERAGDAPKAGVADPHDWYKWRGPEDDGVSREKNLPDTWSPDAKAENNNLVWRKPVGGRTVP